MSGCRDFCKAHGVHEMSILAHEARLSAHELRLKTLDQKVESHDRQLSVIHKQTCEVVIDLQTAITKATEQLAKTTELIEQAKQDRTDMHEAVKALTKRGPKRVY